MKYFELANATEAAIAAGYSSKTARFIGSENLTKPNIIERIDELRDKAEDDAVATVLEMKKMFTKIIRGRFADFMTNLTPEKLRSPALKRLRINEGPRGKTTTIELNSQMEAAEKLCKVMGIYRDGDTTINNNDNRTVNIGALTDDQLDSIARKGIDATGRSSDRVAKETPSA